MRMWARSAAYEAERRLRLIAGSGGNRIARLELFDEVEEWNLIMQHYSLAWASRGLPRPAKLPAYAEAQADHPFKYIN